MRGDSPELAGVVVMISRNRDETIGTAPKEEIAAQVRRTPVPGGSANISQTEGGRYGVLVPFGTPLGQASAVPLKPAGPVPDGSGGWFPTDRPSGALSTAMNSPVSGSTVGKVPVSSSRATPGSTSSGAETGDPEAHQLAEPRHSQLQDLEREEQVDARAHRRDPEDGHDDRPYRIEVAVVVAVRHEAQRERRPASTSAHP